MTEQEWLECTDPNIMLDFLGSKASERKLRLFAVACCRQMWHRLPDERSRTAAEMAERYADGHTTWWQLASAGNDADAVVKEFFPAGRLRNFDAEFAAEGPALASWSCVLKKTAFFNRDSGVSLQWAIMNYGHEVILKDIFGNPIRPITIASSWLSWNDATVVKLAESIYDDRAYDRMPILADALEDAGCDNADTLAHCRSGGPHVRGCWVVDLLLGKA